MKRLLLSFLLLFFAVSQIKAQDTEFWFVAPNLSEQFHATTPLNYPAFLAVSNATNQTAHITITLYNGGSKITIPATVLPGTLFKYDFATAAAIKTIENPRGQAGNVTNYGTHIASDVKVTAYYMMNHDSSKDIYMLKGRNALGTNFYVPMQYDEFYPNESPYYAGACDQIDIVATDRKSTRLNSSH